jgi:hypothetical protein
MLNANDILWVGGAGVIALLLFILVVSFTSRARMFCQYLKAMSGIELKPGEVHRAYKLRGKAGVRELFLDLIIREEVKSSPPITPDSEPQKSITEMIGK